MVVSRLWLCSREGQRLDRVVEKSRAPKALTRVGCKAQFRIWYDADAGEGGNLNSPDKAQAMAMRNVVVKTSQIMNYMVNQSGSYENVGFIRTDLYNRIQAERRAEVEDGDAQGALVYLCVKLDVDARFFYKTNAYKKPFVMLAGVTNHFRTTIFECVLLVNETMDTYTWVLETFMEAMGNKAPVSILTDGDKAMRETIRRVFPDARH
ncbi:protein FAR-RED IMPAIRED RESPONSE 1-like [Camellia sinensis]|uniref:protein FAR-RED IMPAIRED RESPONSE 1-like n=1 Tax=Camellia sinensis TaxID=4442 RepID=UPI001035DCCA|nr:protein FAR-RED IMPAIRED RESPONSE 1-like [Camellia sinensis]